MTSKKEEILEVARKIINQKGLAETSTNDIAKALGISRGTLYYHFKSKEEIIDALVFQLSEKMYARARLVSQNKDLDPLSKFIKATKALSVNLNEDGDIIGHLNDPKNIILNQKVTEDMIKEIPEILIPVVIEGNDQGIFSAKYPREAIELLVAYVLLVIDARDLELDKEAKLIKIQSLLYHMELILGLKSGALTAYLTKE